MARIGPEPNLTAHAHAHVHIYIYTWQRPRQMGQFNSILAIFPQFYSIVCSKLKHTLFLCVFVGPIWAEELISAEISTSSVKQGSKLQKFAFLVH